MSDSKGQKEYDSLSHAEVINRWDGKDRARAEVVGSKAGYCMRVTCGL
jgi:hypothetical protein